MKTLHLALEPLSGYLMSIKRNPIKGWYELEIGLEKSWVYSENKEIGCELITENDEAVLLKIMPKNSKVVVDDLIAFVELIIQTNNKIAEKEKEFAMRMEEMKGILEKEAKNFYEELEVLKESSFKNLNDRFVKNLQTDDKGVVKKGRPVKTKNEEVKTESHIKKENQENSIE